MISNIETGQFIISITKIDVNGVPVEKTTVYPDGKEVTEVL
ncbi:hypothetical protein Metho_1234 [Methanomethylovorans hollandica DSM 15978]|uniref:Uncharacterized protein n=1 Tax=Methanomethylovorans hollandica (strain DSM 15978 / NBRC 107637 / DMS1) TaxID=867904 RepID=L0KZP4_METHD|nr:hypothetical protein [Methanomethylovorans hollandica]AGB49464.1 hypothetical protein Metho_1234 [Methanomethylovorans hollandica DSM 15978]